MDIDQHIIRLRALRDIVSSLEQTGEYPAELAMTTAAAWRNPANFLNILTGQPHSFADQRAELVTAMRAELETFAEIDPGECERVLVQIGRAPREEFMPPEIRAFAYLPGNFAIGYNQTISSPHTVAVMTIAARLPSDAHVLDVGTGSGYQAAILCGVARSVVSLEIIPDLAQTAQERLCRLGYPNVRVIPTDGGEGLSAEEPFDAIIVAAGTHAVPRALVDQLKPGGKLVIPIGRMPEAEQIMEVVRERDGTAAMRSLGPARFVPLTGAMARQPLSVDADYSDVPFAYGQAVT